MKENLANANTLKNVLVMYCQSSVQLVSSAKSNIFLSPNNSVLVRENICNQLDILTKALTDKYMRLPFMVGVDRSDFVQHLVDRVCEKLKGWKEKMLFVGAKEALLKVMAQGIPS